MMVKICLGATLVVRGQRLELDDCVCAVFGCQESVGKYRWALCLVAKYGGESMCVLCLVA